MPSRWDGVFGAVDERIPPFNDYLLLDYRRDKLAEILNYIHEVFQMSLQLFEGKVEYRGCKPLSPEEQKEHILRSKILNGKVEIKRSTTVLYKFEFKFGQRVESTYISLPYMEGNAIVWSDECHYPRFPVIERGGIHRIDNGVRVKVMVLPIAIWRKKMVTLKTVEGKSIRDINVTVKLFYGNSKSKKTENTPLLLYHFTKFGLWKTLAMFGFSKDEFDIVTSDKPKNGYCHIKIKPDIFMRIKLTALKDMYKRRTVISLYIILTENKRYTINELKKSPAYFQVTLGQFTNPSRRDKATLYSSAAKHIKTMDVAIDQPARQQLKSVGIAVTDTYDFLQKMFFKIDDLVNTGTYDPTNLFDKKIGSLRSVTSGLVRSIFSKQFNIINDDNVGLNEQSFSKFLAQSSKYGNWFQKGSSGVFTANPSLYNDNWLLAIGSKRFRSLENTDSSSLNKKTQRKKSGKIPGELFKAHPSQLVVDSVLSIPSSSPLESGTINPYLQIDQDGNIQIPPFVDELDGVFNYK